MKYLLIGNPNVGKSSLFNRLTDSYAPVGNIGGVTVESKVGIFEHGEIVDLPGTYNVAPSSEDEGVVTNTLIYENYDTIINIVDGTHLKRNLQLTIELLELGKPMYLVVNMADELEQAGFQLNVQALEQHLGIPVILTSARTGFHMDVLKETLKDKPKVIPVKITYHPIIEDAIKKIEQTFKHLPHSINKRWLAVQLLSGNKGLHTLLTDDHLSNLLKIVTKTEQKVIDRGLARSIKGLIYQSRREQITRIVDGVLIPMGSTNDKKFKSQRIDKILMHPVWGIVIFILVLFGLYTLTFDLLGNHIAKWLEFLLFERLTPFIEHFFIQKGIPSDNFILRLFIEGIIPGVGGVLVFVPNILILFALIAIIDGTGYIARVAVLLDTLLKRFGLNGKTIIPLITGIGCNVPAIMATRTIEDKNERRLTMMIIPFMSCSARIPIYGLMASLFFERYRGFVILSMYVIGAVVALLSAKILSLSIFKVDQKHFVLEIPPYRIPSVQNVYRYTKMMVKDFINKAGKFILLGTMILFFLQYLGPTGIVESQEDSFLALGGRILAPLFAPLGFGNWQAASSLIVGFFAKEMIYSSMMIIYGGKGTIAHMFTPASALSFMVFSLLYMPCLATVGVIRQESQSLRFTTSSLIFSFVVSYLISVCLYGLMILI